MLAILTVPVVNGGSGWKVKKGATPDELLVSIDESRRPLLLAGNAAARAAAAAFSAAEPRPSFAFLTVSGDSPLDQGLVLIRSETAVEVKLAAVTATTAERQLELRNLGKGTAKLTAKVTTTNIGGNATYALAPGGRITLRSDGAGKNWRIIASIEGRS